MLNKQKYAQKRKKNFERIIFIVFSFIILFATSLDAQDVGKATDLRFWALDVGQADCMFFMFPNGKSMLVDAGLQKTPSVFDDAKEKRNEGKKDRKNKNKENNKENKIVQFLNKHLDDNKTIDLVVATHHHADHINSMKDVINKFDILEIWDKGSQHGSGQQRQFYKAIQKKQKKTNKKISFEVVKAGDSKNFGDTTVQVLAPSNNNLDENNKSIVLLVTYKKVSFLLTGDMEQPERNTFNAPQATILKIAHHGSRNGTDPQFLSQVNPSIVVLSYGERNPYRHPHKEVVKALGEYDNKSDFENFGWQRQKPKTDRTGQGLKKLIRLDTVNGDICIATDGETYIEDNRNNYLVAKIEMAKGWKSFKQKIKHGWKQFWRYLKST